MLKKLSLSISSVLLAFAMVSFLPNFGAAQAQTSNTVLLAPVDGAVGPATAGFVHRVLEKARQEKATLVVLKLDTPGGLDTAMRDIIKDVLASSVPVAVFVAPSGARAASAGTYILYASHIAAMAPGTNLGAATPVQIGGWSKESPGVDKPQRESKDNQPLKKPIESGEADVMSRKQLLDSVAYIRSLAQLRGRNAEWAEQAVREAVSLPAQEALQLKVIDVLANDVSDLLHKINGRSVSVPNQQIILNLTRNQVVLLEPSWQQRLLAIITHPSIAYILMLIGIYGLIFEFANPGLVAPGVVGAVCLILALFSFQLLPINYAGLGLIILGIAFFVVEAFMPSFGILGIGGIIAFSIGSIMLIDTDLPGYGIPLSLIAFFTLLSGLFLVFVVGAALKARKQKIVSGKEQMVGSVGEALQDFESEGWVWVRGEQWKAKSQSPIGKGQKIRVIAMSGLLLEITPDNSK